MEKKSFLQIDLLELEREWVEQSDLFQAWARKLALARTRVDESEAQFDLVKAELDAKIRRNPERFGIEKASETAYKNAVIMHKRYQVAQAKVIAAKRKVGIYQATVTALDHRKKALENVVTLHGQQYWSVPSAGEQDRRKMRDIERKATRRKVKIEQ